MNDVHYSAFISYRHVTPDREIATKLHTLIENYGIPSSIKKRLGISKMGRVFRDEEELPLSSDLGGDIYRALDNSDWLIVICSPSYLESKWCKAELDYFISIGKKDRILTVLADGEPGSAFPEVLRFEEKDGIRKEIEPLAADVRAQSLQESLKKLGNEKLRILAPMLGVVFDDLRQRAHRRQMRIIGAASAAGLVLLTGFLIFAIIKNGQIAKQRDLAMDNQMQLLIEEANVASSGGSKLNALSKLKEAAGIRETVGEKNDKAFSAALEYALCSEPFESVLTIDSNNRQFKSLVFSHNDDWLLGITNMNSAALIDASTGKIEYTVSRSDLGQLDSVGFTLDDKYFYMVDSWYGFVSLYRVEDGQLAGQFDDSSDMAWNIGEKVFPVDDSTLLILREQSMVLWNYIKGSEKEILPCGSGTFESYTRPLIVDLSPDRKSVVVGSHGYGTGMKILSLDGKTETALEFDAGRGYPSIMYSGDGKRIAAVSGNMYFIWDADSGKLLLEGVNETKGYSQNMLINYDGSILLTMTSEFLNAVDTATGEVLWEKTADSNVITECRISPNGKYVSAEGGISGVFDIETGELLFSCGSTLFSNDSSKVISAAYSSDACLLVTPAFATKQYEKAYSGKLFSTPRYTDPGAMISISIMHSPGDYYSTFPGNAGRKQQAYVSPDTKYVAWTHYDGFIEIFDISDRENVLNIYTLAEHCYNSVEDLIFSGKTMASCGGYDPRCVLFDLEKGGISFVLAGEEYCHRAEFSEDGSKIIMLCGRAKDRAFVYSVESGTLLYSFRCEEGRYIEDIGFDEEKGKVVALLDNGDALTGIIYKGIDDMLIHAEKR